MLDMNVRSFVLRFTENLYKRKLLFLLPVLLTAGAGYYLAQGVDEYNSEGVVLVDGETFLASLTDVRTEGFSFRSPSDLAHEQLNGLLSTDTFIQAIVDESGLESQIRGEGSDTNAFYDSVRRAIWADPGGEQFLTISAQAAEPEMAQQLAAAAIETFLQWQIAADLEQTRLAEDFVDDLVVTYNEELTAAQGRLSEWVTANPGPSRIEDRPVDEQLALQLLQSEVGEASARFNSAITKREEARLASAQAEADIRQSFSVLDQPEVASDPQNGVFDLALTTMLFAMVGALMSIAVLAIMSASDASLRFPTEVQEFLGADLLAVIPKVAKP